MRNFEERKAEVLQRSADRIRTRARVRSRILAACIPLILCVTAVVLVSQPWSDGGGDIILSSHPQSGTEENHSSPGTQPHETLVEVSMGRLRKTYSDAAAVGSITDALNSLSSAKTPLPEGGEPVADFGVNASSTACRITVRTGADAEVFLLSGLYLKSETTGKIYRLSQNERNELNALLGISQHETQ